MNKTTYCLFTALALLIFTQPVVAKSPDIVIVQSTSTSVRENIIDGINSVLEGRAVVMKVEDLYRNSKEKPRLFLAIGSDALNAVKDRGVPVIFSMVMNPYAGGLKGRQVTGIEVFISFENQIDELRAVLPKATKVGVIYAKTAEYVVSRAREAAQKRGITIIGRDWKKGEAAAEIMSGMHGVDAIWLLPDTTITPEMVKHLIGLAQERNIPVLSPSGDDVKDGALLGVGINATQLGHQMGEMANRVLAGEAAAVIPIEPVKKWNLYINLSIARKLGLQIPPDILRRSALYKDVK